MAGRLVLLVALVAAAAGPGCWYNTTGRSGANVGDIYIPFFEDETSGERAVNLGLTMTELVVREFQQDRSIRVYQAAAERSQAQKELLGTVKRVSETVTTRDEQERGEEYRVVVTCAVTYRDLQTDKVLWQDASLSGDANYLLAEGEAGFQRALQEALERVLDQILDHTIKAW